MRASDDTLFALKQGRILAGLVSNPDEALRARTFEMRRAFRENGGDPRMTGNDGLWATVRYNAYRYHIRLERLRRARRIFVLKQARILAGNNLDDRAGAVLRLAKYCRVAGLDSQVLAPVYRPDGLAYDSTLFVEIRMKAFEMRLRLDRIKGV